MKILNWPFKSTMLMLLTYICWIVVVMLAMTKQKLVREFYTILNQVNTEEIPHGLKLPDSFSQLVSEMKNNQYDARNFAFVLRAMVCCM